jgi:hypothetical protein
MSGSDCLDAFDHCQRRDASGLADRHEGTGRPVHRDRIGLHLKPIMHRRDIAHEDRLAIDFLDRKRVNRFDHIRTVVHRQRVVLASDLYVASWQDHVLALESLADIRRRESARL